MKVSKLFIVLIVVVACILVGALILNVLLPNTMTMAINTVEDAIFKATGISWDINADGNAGDNNTSQVGDRKDSSSMTSGDTVEGFN